MQYGEIAKGFHDLFPYVYENWLDHLQQYRRFTAADAASLIPPELTDLLHRLARAIEKHNDMAGPEDTGEPDDRPARTSVPHIIEDLVVQWQALSRSQRLAGLEDSEVSEMMIKDPSILSSAYAHFQTAFESLMNDFGRFTLSDMNVSKEQLHDFRARHSQFAYLCRYHGCVRASAGFSSLLERKKHELSHRPQYHCEDPACTGADGAFNTKASLKRHVERYHRKMLDDAVLPDFPVPKISPSKLSDLGMAARVQIRNESSLGQRDVHTPNERGDEDPERLPSLVGEMKNDQNGYLKGGRKYKMRTFHLPNRGEQLFMFAEDCAQMLGYRSSDALFNCNPGLQRLFLDPNEAERLPIGPLSNPQPWSISIVTARSIFREFGSRAIINGQRVRDDYWELIQTGRESTADDDRGSIAYKGHPFVSTTDHLGHHSAMPRPTTPRLPEEQYRSYKRTQLVASGISAAEIEDHVETAWRSLDSESRQQLTKTYETQMIQHRNQMDLYDQICRRESAKLAEEKQLQDDIAALLAKEAQFESKKQNDPSLLARHQTQSSLVKRVRRAEAIASVLVDATKSSQVSLEFDNESGQASTLFEWVQGIRSKGMSGQFQAAAHGYVKIVSVGHIRYLTFYANGKSLPKHEPVTAPRAFLLHEIDESECDFKGRTVLAQACSLNNVDIVKARLADHPGELFLADNTGQTPLHIAAASGCINVARTLIQAGCIIDTVDGYGATPLATTVEHGLAEMARLLLKHGANPKHVDEADIMKLVFQRQMGFWEMQAILTKQRAEYSDRPYVAGCFIIKKACKFRMVGDSLIRFSGPSNEGLALYFKDNFQVGTIWALLDYYGGVEATESTVAVESQLDDFGNKANKSSQHGLPYLVDLDLELAPNLSVNWSAPETQKFLALISVWGRNFAEIAGVLKTKTPVMVAEHYHKLVASGIESLKTAADVADERNAKAAASGQGYPVIVVEDPDEYRAEDRNQTRSGSAYGSYLPAPSERTVSKAGNGMSSDNPIELDDDMSSPDELGITPSWSFDDRTRLRDLMRTYGKDWKFLAEVLGTKSEKMIARYFDQEVAAGRYELVNAAREAEMHIQINKASSAMDRASASMNRDKQRSSQSAGNDNDQRNSMLPYPDLSPRRVRDVNTLLRAPGDSNNGVATISPAVLNQILASAIDRRPSQTPSPKTMPRNQAAPTDREIIVSRILNNPENFFSQLPHNLRDFLNSLPPDQWLAVLERYEEVNRNLKVPTRDRTDDDVLLLDEPTNGESIGSGNLDDLNLDMF